MSRGTAGERLAASGPNADQIEYWNAAAGEKWARHQDVTERLLAPVADRLLAAAAPRRGEHVLDIGCGCGATSVALAARVGESGSVLGVDISEPMLARARAASSAASFLLADAALHPFPPGGFDLAVSRFGVMFFADPVAAFANIRKSLKQDGRLVFVCWQEMSANPWVIVPVTAALRHLPPPEPPDPHAPGPFAFADAARVRMILRDAGFGEVSVEPAAFTLAVGAEGPDPILEAARFVEDIGPLSRMLGDVEETTRAAVRASLRDVLAPYAAADGVKLGGACWLVEARP